jgi:hypothetical protein
MHDIEVARAQLALPAKINRNRTMRHRAPLSPQPKPPLPPELVGATGIVSMGAPSEERDIEKLLSIFYLSNRGHDID